MPLIYFDDIRLNAVITGPDKGPPLVLIHALGTDLTLWDDVIPLLICGGTAALMCPRRPMRWAR
jgi:pimeloyl-ACP methyl ester carboxylesterase